MDDDFNTADALAAVFELVKFINTSADENSSSEYLRDLLDRLRTLTDVLGLIVEKEEEMLDEEIEKPIEERQAARKAKDFSGQMRSGMSWRQKASSWKIPVRV